MMEENGIPQSTAIWIPSFTGAMLTKSTGSSSFVTTSPHYIGRMSLLMSLWSILEKKQKKSAS
jgi:hypothetical protein